MTSTLVCDDVLAWAATYHGEPFHACLSDAPYSLGDGRRGFMGRAWDTSIAFRPETWTAVAQHLLPGAFLMVFGSARGWHRLACALEDAGLMLHPSIFGWGYGSGFPKATRIDTQVDQDAGEERAYVGEGPYASRRPHVDHGRQGLVYADDAYVRPAGDARTAPVTPLAQAWAGHRYGLQALKPALEPIIVAQIPYAGCPVDSITTHGAGALWINGGRVAGPEPDQNSGRTSEAQSIAGPSVTPWNTPMGGRWPSNLALCHLPTCQPLGTQQVQGTNIPGPGARPVGYSGCYGVRAGIQNYAAPDGTETVQAYQCADGCPVRALDRQAGERRVGGGSDMGGGTRHVYDGRWLARSPLGYGDRGPASRFFSTLDWSLDVAEQLAKAEAVRYCPKASPAERHAGLEAPNPHPCIKPLALVRWLATLLLPPAAYAPRRLLVPFCGTGSEMIGGRLAGWEYVVGIESEASSVAIADRRIAWWTGMAPTGPLPPPSTAVAEPAAGRQAQLSLFA